MDGSCQALSNNPNGFIQIEKLKIWKYLYAYNCLQELELYKPELIGKPAILALNKMDKEGAEDKLQETLQLLNSGKCCLDIVVLKVPVPKSLQS